ncbi:3-hydroxyacyl-ACP dehydratase FabZ [Kutzneria viridogrisea]|uniref:3-hydroxylacyl-ACP dehydratase n=2 Tax=Kutzneria TaxID=43356 RepID=W5WFY8_9PSEU|nr:hotdog domain-containing protein [Kutzneria albida]AHH99630.1 hypothetical protein KALB_6270 [Kutzneria albida DSM 43870]MBA8922814.1 3-hydroxyacyl-[acyl-carrier-protein] dehydratase [Kutzneria viridogrisea]
MNFHLVDRIDLIEPRRRVLACKLTSFAEQYWRDDGRGVEMPPALVLEALCQAGNWLVLASTGLSRSAALLSVDRTRFGAPVRPGDVLVLDGVVESFGADTAAISGTVRVDGQEVLAADTILCALIPSEELDDPAALGCRLEALTGGAR